MLRVWFATQLRLFGGSSGLLELACVNCLHTNDPSSSAEFEWYHKHWSHTRSVITYKRGFFGRRRRRRRRRKTSLHTVCAKIKAVQFDEISMIFFFSKGAALKDPEEGRKKFQNFFVALFFSFKALLWLCLMETHWFPKMWIMLLCFGAKVQENNSLVY